MPTEPSVNIVAPTAQEVDDIRGYRIGKWHTYDNYECVQCQYSTLWKDKMEKHLAADVHVWAYPGQNPPDDMAGNEPEYG